MRIDVMEKGRGLVEVLVELGEDEVADELERAAVLTAYERKIEPDPQRQPVEAVRAALGDAEASFAFDQAVMAHCAPLALGERELDIVGAPKLTCSEHAQEGRPFAFRMTCVPVPAFELSSYDAVEVAMPPLAVADDAVEEQVQALAQASAEQATDTSHDVVRSGDTVELAMETVQDGRRLRPLSAASRTYNTGSLSMPDDFDAAVVGMAVGQTKTFDFQGPSFQLNADGSPVMESFTSTVTVKRILTKVAPDTDDAWASRVMPGCSSMDDLRERVRMKLLAQQRGDYAKQKDRLTAGELAKRLDAKIADEVYEAAFEEAKGMFNAQLAEQGQTLEQFLQQQNMEEQQLTMSLMMQVRDQLTRQFALDAYARHEGLAAEDEDLDAFFAAIAPGNAQAARSDFEQSGKLYAARCAALRLKANRLLSERAIVHDAAPAASAGPVALP